MTENPERAAQVLEYYETAPEIVAKINELENPKKIWKSLFWKNIVPFAEQVISGNNDKAYEMYKDIMVKTKSLVSEKGA